MDEPAVSQFIDDAYIRLWAGALGPERTAAEADGLWTLAGLAPGARVLDAPGGYSTSLGHGSDEDDLAASGRSTPAARRRRSRPDAPCAGGHVAVLAERPG